MRFKLDWASLIVGSNFIVFTLFYFVFEGNFPSISPRGASIWRGDFTEGFLRYRCGGLYLEGLIFGILQYLVKHKYVILGTWKIVYQYRSIRCGRTEI